MDKKERKRVVSTWVKKDGVFDLFAREGKSPHVKTYSWLKDMYESNGGKDFEQVVSNLADLWFKALIYVHVYHDNGDLVAKTSKELSMSGGFELKNCENFSTRCHNLLKALYDIGVRDSKDVTQAIEGVRVAFATGNQNVEKWMTETTAAKFDLLEDIALCCDEYIKQFVPKPLRNAFEDVSVM